MDEDQWKDVGPSCMMNRTVFGPANLRQCCVTDAELDRGLDTVLSSTLVT